MSRLDWLVLAATLVAIVVYGVWKGRRQRTMENYILAGRQLHWPTIALSIMATQASAITFLSTPGQAYTDGMRFVQFYLGLPVAMVLLCIFAVPIYHSLKVYTAYEYLESRFGVGTRTLTATLFLIQRGLSNGITIYAPALIVSVILGWNIHLTNIVIGALVIVYTTFGGAKAVSWTHVHQLLIALGGMVVALVIAIRALPHDVSLIDAVRVAGRMGRLNAIDFSFNVTTPYNFWSGMIGGLFVALSYFGTDQSQVQRYLTGETEAESKLGLLFNGLVKVPMQFFILFVGAMVFVFYQFVAPPLFFNPTTNGHGPAYERAAAMHRVSWLAKRDAARALVAAMHAHDDARVGAETSRLREAQEANNRARVSAAAAVKLTNPKVETSDTNYVFLSFVIRYLPHGLVGLLLAAIFCAAMSSTSSGLNSLASTSAVDIYRRLINPNASDHDYVRVSRLLTLFWGVFGIAFAEFVGQLGSLVEAVNRLGSLFYGTMLGIFVLAVFTKNVTGTATVIGAIVAEAATVACWLFTNMAWLWWNVVGLAVTIGAALLITLGRRSHVTSIDAIPTDPRTR
jgi:SSS family transporter